MNLETKINISIKNRTTNTIRFRVSNKYNLNNTLYNKIYHKSIIINIVRQIRQILEMTM